MSGKKENDLNNLHLTHIEPKCVEDSSASNIHDCQPLELFQMPTDLVSMSHKKLSHSSHHETDDKARSAQTLSKSSKDLIIASSPLSSESSSDSNQVCGSRTVLKSNLNVEAKAGSTGAKVLGKRSAAFPVTAEAELEAFEDCDESSVEGAINDSNMDHANDDSISFATAMEKKQDMFCWRCHRIASTINCAKCPRSYHSKCLKNENLDLDNGSCPECVLIAKAEDIETRNDTLKKMPKEHLCYLFKFALSRMMKCQGAEPFMQPVSVEDFPEYTKYIIQPMDLETLKSHLIHLKYNSPQAFEVDAKWILHNSIIFNSTQSKLTSIAKAIMKICKHEMSELENCPSCYLNANTKKSTWFVEVCPKPHLLVWAKLKGFPFWPAKVMRYNSNQGLVDVGFFGAHDRAWVPVKECYLFCEKDPNTFKPKRYDIEHCLEEMDIHINKLKQVYGEFRYAEFKTLIDPNNEVEQLRILLPKYSHKPYLDTTYVTNCEGTMESDESGNDESSEISNEDVDAINASLSDNPKKNISFDATFDSTNLMEGYGTDDESLLVVDAERRKIYNKRLKDTSDTKDSNIMEIDDGDDEDDTQVPNNISIDNCVSDGNASKFLNSSEGQKIPPRRKSEVEFGSNRLLDYCPKAKISRRNSDMTVRPDYGHITGISEKINRVDIKENMEISLGIISENVSLQNGDSSKDNEHSMELKRKPVQVDIDNAEFSISPTNKLKITEKLMKRLSEDSNHIDEAKRKVPNVDDLHNSHNATVANTSNTNDKDSLNNSYHLVDRADLENEVCKDNDTSYNKYELVNKPIEKNDTDTDKEENSSRDCEELTATIQNVSSELNNVLESTTNKPKIMVQPSITEFTTKTLAKNSIDSNLKGNMKRVAEVEESDNLEKGEFSRLQVNGSYAVDTNDETDPDIEASLVSDIQMDKFDLFNIIHSSLNHETDLKKAVVISREINIEEPHSQPENADQVSVEEPSKVQDKLTEGTDSQITTVSESCMSRDLVVQLLNYGESIKDVTDTVDIIKKQNCQKLSPEKHIDVEGVLGEIRVKKLPKERDRLENELSIDISENGIRRPSSEGKSKSGLKRKLSHGSSSEKQKKMAYNPASGPLSDMEEIIIKSEPECSDDDFTELEEDLEKKRKYLSALDISEKIDNPSRENHLNQIRTRSKAEEKRAKFLAFDNLSKTIDDVATNYGALQEEDLFDKNKEVNSSDDPKRQFNSSSSKFKAVYPGQRARKSFPAPIYSIASDIPKTSAHNTYLRVVQPSNHVKAGKSTAETNSNVPHVILLHPSSIVNTVYDRPLSTTCMKTVSHGTSSSQLTVPSTSKSSLLMTQILQPLIRPPVYIQKQSSKVQAGNASLLRHKLTGPNTQGSQNYIPLQKSSISTSSQSSPRIILNETITPPGMTSKGTSTHVSTSNSAPSTSQDSNNSININSNSDNTSADNGDDSYEDLHRLLPDNLGQTLSQIMLKPTPKPKPRPPGILSQRFDTGIPSSAGAVTSKINSIAHRMADYFRGMLIETIEEFGSKNAEGKVVALELELEHVKHVHKQEIEDIRGNFTRILAEVQQSIAREREELEEKIRAECEAETIKRIELAKSKQWCANCSKEAQFYCCWNTSYCDYPCQQKHWTQHMKNCTQHLEKSSSKAGTPYSRKSQTGSSSNSLIKQGMGLQRPQMPSKVYPRASGLTKKMKTSSGNRITMIKTPPTNLNLQDPGVVRVAGIGYPLNSSHTSGIIRVSSPSPPPTTTAI